jgi:IS30 family transposase
MPARRELTMRQIRQMLRLAHEGVSAREIGRTLGIARSTVQDNLGRASAAGLGSVRGRGVNSRTALAGIGVAIGPCG